MKKILLFSDENEPLTNVLLKNKDALNIQAYSTRVLLENSKIFDKICGDFVTINWYFPGGEHITNDDNTYLINRVFFVDNDLFKNFREEDREYGLSEFYSYLMFAIQSFKKKSESIGSNGHLCGNLYHMPGQWSIVKDILPNIKTPKFFFGNKNFLPLDFDDKSLIITNPYNFYNWRVEPSEDEDIFAIERPSGIPFLVSVFKEKCFVESLDSNYSTKNLTKICVKKIEEFSKIIHDNFGYFVSESLFFIDIDDEESIIFAMISNVPNAFQCNNNFESLVCEHFCR